MNYAYTLWHETTGDGTRFFWIVDNLDNDKVVASGIEETETKALEKIRQYCPDADPNHDL